MQNTINYLYSLFIKYPVVCTDTRHIIAGSIFFALKGENFNANAFASAAIQRGCAYAVIDEKKYKTRDRFILVDNVLKTLHQLAAYHRKHLTIPVIGITGTNGKTTTKELINAVLSKKFRVYSTQGNFNNHIGVPLTLLSVKDDAEIAVVEMGANHPGEIGELCLISSPNYGIITNIGKAHIEGFGNMETIVNTKKELYDSIRSSDGKIFVSRDNSLLMDISEGMEIVTYGVSPDSDCRGEITESNPLLKLKWYCKSQRREIDMATNLFGFFNFENVLASICIGNYFGVSPDEIRDALEMYIPSNNRSQVIKTKKNIILMDAYNANPDSMEASLKNFIQITTERKFAIIGDMLELGEEAVREHFRIFELLENSGFEKILLVGKVFTSLKGSVDYPAFTDIEKASIWVNEMKPEGYTILIKGSRGIKLEKLLEYL